MITFKQYLSEDSAIADILLQLDYLGNKVLSYKYEKEREQKAKSIRKFIEMAKDKRADFIFYTGKHKKKNSTLTELDILAFELEKGQITDYKKTYRKIKNMMDSIKKEIKKGSQQYDARNDSGFIGGGSMTSSEPIKRMLNKFS